MGERRIQISADLKNSRRAPIIRYGGDTPWFCHAHAGRVIFP
jgi:hypothetical protein